MYFIDSPDMDVNVQGVSSRGSKNTSEDALTNQMCGHRPLVVTPCFFNWNL